MMEPILPENEQARLAALQEYGILDTMPEKAFDDLARLAASICATPMALISLVDHTREWFKSHIGVDSNQTERCFSFCGHALHSPDLFVVGDATQDRRFADNPFVTQAPYLRFYAGIPLVTPEGFVLGTLCVLDQVPRQLTLAQKDSLTTLGRSVMALMEQRRLHRQAVRAQEELRASEAVLSAVLQSSLDAIIRFLPDGCILDWNTAAAALFGYTSAEAVKLSWEDLLPSPDQQNRRGAARASITAFLHKRRVEILRKASGATFLGEVTLTRLPGSKDENGGTVFCAFVRDVTQQHQAESDLRAAHQELERRVVERTAELLEQQQFLRRVLDTDPNFIFVKNAEGVFTLANAAIAAAYGTTPEKLVGKRDDDFNPHADETRRFSQDDALVIRSGNDKIIPEEKVTRVDGQVRWMQTIKRPLPSRDGAVRELLGISTDITAHKAAKEALTHQAFHDELTGLPNRALFLNRLEKARSRHRGAGRQIAVLFLDLDNFKVINDSLGHQAGDLLLQEVARRLSGCIAPGDTVARIGGDEFTLLLENVQCREDPIKVAESIAQVLREPLQLVGRQIAVTTSIAIAVAQEDADTGDLLRFADTAMYEAKVAGNPVTRCSCPA